MSALFGLLGCAGVVVFLIMFVIAAIKKGNKKTPLIGLLACFVLVIVAVATTPTAAEPKNAPPAQNVAEPVATEPEKAPDAGQVKPESPAPEVKPAEPTMTTGQKNALASAKSYLSMTAFSHSSLVSQLEYEKYSNEDAVYAADNCGADWNEQAVKSAKNYLNMASFSRDGLIEQLEYEGFTHEQAVYGAEQNGY